MGDDASMVSSCGGGVAVCCSALAVLWHPAGNNKDAKASSATKA